MNTVSIKISEVQVFEVERKLLDTGFKYKKDPNPYLKWKLVGYDVTALLYTSGKLVVQGNGDVQAVLDMISGKEKVSLSPFIPHIGADEVGKGDFFGPLVVCACYIPQEGYEEVIKAGVGDSKKFRDDAIVRMYDVIKKSVIYTVKVIQPREYNFEYIKFKNIAKLLANEHALNIKALISKLGDMDIDYKYAVIDQFSTNKGRLEEYMSGIEFKQMHHAESQDLTVAAASVIARRYFVEQMDRLSQQYAFVFPKGATNVIEQGKQFVSKYGIAELENVAKTSFRTTLMIV
ncbi:MAG: Ribonuclease HIII [candidate division WS6 bacterium GW2011_GWF2_39_15]|uniref:Ribonuclease n=1 Tax=candidate division WS6 bacterium GW2011_GWF2_39_15 TaxID=1619100 RepID=A0A0G0QXI8_9BACT|nr:MAG: Ribonuclease HIII [candidate division WS6 bacterium GW2011_GWF2_39_15]